MGDPRVPTFGYWNQDPTDVEGYTVVFDRRQRVQKSSSHDITNARNTHFPSQRKLSKQIELSKSGSSASEEPKSGNWDLVVEALGGSSKPQMNPDEDPSLPYFNNARKSKASSSEPQMNPDESPLVPEPKPPSVAMAAKHGSVPNTDDEAVQRQKDNASVVQHSSDCNQGASPHTPTAPPALIWAQLGTANIGYKAMDKLKQRVSDVVSHSKNIVVLQTKIQVLMEEVDEVQPFLMSGENDIKDEVHNWFSEASEILKDANSILEGRNIMADKKRVCITCWDPTSSWVTGEMLRSVNKILDKRKVLDLSSSFCGLSYCNKLQSRENKLWDIMEALMDIQINMIGINGMTGVGKTILANELARRAQNNQLFDVIVMVQVSESVDVKLIQSQISNKIGLPLSEADDEETRAHLLYNVLEEKVMERGREIDCEPVQQSKILVILDGIQHAFDLMKVGIPDKGTSRCKVVLLSRNEDVCKEMGAEKNFSVGCLNLDEAKCFFRESLENKIQSTEITIEKYQYMENIMLMKCGGLPLMINSLTRTLRSMSWSNWEILSDKMLKHALVEVDELKEVPCAILELCNNFIRNGDKHKLFLLCCLIQQGVDVPLEKLRRYGMGFGLFEDDSLHLVHDQLNLWIQELKSLSLLSEAKAQHVKIHDVIQDVGISALSQGDYVLQVLLDVGTCWYTREAYENCVAISMIPDSNFKWFIGLELNKLQAFLLKDEPSLSPPSSIYREMPDMKILKAPHNLFGAMQDLKILEIYETKLVEFPSSIQDLKNLVTLHLEYCDIKCEIISTVSKLDKLKVLSLRGSSIEALPEEIGKLTNLRVLDLTSCNYLRTVCVDAVVKMVRLNELYLYDSYSDWNTNDMKKLSKLPLEVLEVILTRRMSSKTQNVRNLRRFKICVGRQFGDLDYISCFSKALLINDYSCLGVVESGLRCLLPLTEFLGIKEIDGFSEDIADLYGNVFLQLKSIYIVQCKMKCILDGSRGVFPKLENLTLENLSYLTSICRWQPHHTFFPQVRELRLKDLRQLHEYVLPIQFAVKLRVLEVIKCICLLHIFQTEQIFEIDRDDSSHELPYMEILELRDLKGLQALQNSPHDSINRDKRLVLFNGKIKLPSLKTIKLEHLSQISHLWDLSASKECATELLQSQAYGISAWFGNLKRLTVSQHDNTNSLFTSTILNSLLQLETLIVEACHNLKEVITNSSNAEDEANPTTMIIFPRLRVLHLQSMGLRCFYSGPHFLEFPMLKELHLFELWEMKAFVLPRNQSIQPEVTTLFDGDQIGFPSLEHLEVSRMYHIELLQREGETTIFPLLSRLTLKGWPNLKSLHTINSKSLRFLDLRSIVCGQVLFSVQPTYMPSMSPEISWELEELTLSGIDSLEELVDDDKSFGKLLFCLKKLELCYLWQLRTIPWNMLKSLCSFTIYGLQSLTSLISITLLFEGVVLPSLEYIKVENCRSLETIVSQEELQEEHQDFVKHGITLFSSLKTIQFYSLPRLESFNNGSYEVHFPSLETVEIHECSSFKSFSMGPLRTPRLNSVMLDSKAMEVDTFDDLNSEVAAHQAAATARRNAEEVIKLRARAEEAKARRPRKESGVWEGGKPIAWSFEDN